MAMFPVRRRLQRFGLLAAVMLAVTYVLFYGPPFGQGGRWRGWGREKPFDWANRPQKYPVLEANMTRLPQGAPHPRPRIQHDFSQDRRVPDREKTLAIRRKAIQDTFNKCWTSYKQYAWGYDELLPQSLKGRDNFAGWGATMIDALDTLYIMGMQEDFALAVRQVARVDWNHAVSSSCSLFETNIRYLGGLLSAYDLSGEAVLLDKALELGHMLYAAFDNPNHMPVNAFYFARAKSSKLDPDRRESSAAIGTLSLEFTRLSQLTGIPKFYHAIDNIKLQLERTQNITRLPGMWPTHIDLRDFTVFEGSFTLGGPADSLYEYLPKMHMLLGGLDKTYARMHLWAAETARDYLLFRPMMPEGDDADILFSGTARFNGKEISRITEIQHLGCFAGGLFALSGRLFDLPEQVDIGEKLARGCAWAYRAFPTGIMPEIAHIIACNPASMAPCPWDEARQDDLGHPRFPPGFRGIRNAKYILRPEAVESLFVLYRITGNVEFQDLAWEMFLAIKKATETAFAHSAIMDVNVKGTTEKLDSMESFWLAETLKYFYLIFSDPNLISLDDYVLNTEAHPFKLPKPVEPPTPPVMNH